MGTFSGVDLDDVVSVLSDELLMDGFDTTPFQDFTTLFIREGEALRFAS